MYNCLLQSCTQQWFSHREQGIGVRCTIQLLTISIVIRCRVKSILHMKPCKTWVLTGMWYLKPCRGEIIHTCKTWLLTGVWYLKPCRGEIIHTWAAKLLGRRPAMLLLYASVSKLYRKKNSIQSLLRDISQC